MIFEKKYFSLYILLTGHILLTDQVSIALLPCLILEILNNMCTKIICCPACVVINFEIYHSSLIKPFFYRTKKSGQECTYFMKEKSLITNKKQKHFSSVLKEFQTFKCQKLSQIESGTLNFK